MDSKVEAVRKCLPYATSTAHTEQLEGIVDAEIDRVLAESEQAVAAAEAVLARVRAIGAIAGWLS